MFCALSGDSPEEPVVSKVSGSLFEKRLILKYISDNVRDPVTGEQLTVEDLLPLKLTSKFIKPRPPAASSIPNLLMSLQNEWDSVMLETYQLKQQYHTARQELANALYENDAAKRVIARLMVERDEARAALASVQANYTAPDAAASASDDRMDVDEADKPELSEDLAVAHAKMTAHSGELSKVRRKRKVAATCATPEQVTEYSQLYSLAGVKGSTVNAVDVVQQTFGGEQRDWIITGGNKGKVIIMDRNDEGKTVTQASAGKANIRDVAWRGTEAGSLSFLTAGADKTIQLFDVEQSGDSAFSISKAKHVWKTHTNAVTALNVHPTGEYFVSASEDGTWALNDISSGQTLTSVSLEGKIRHSAAHIHPDGLILATGGSDSVVRLWDLKSQSNVQDFTGHTSGNITAISFSENGYYLATSSDAESVVKLWDLRKLVNFETIELSGGKAKGVSKVRFDYSGQFLGVAYGEEFRVYLAKKWTQLCSLSGHKDTINDFQFGKDAQFVVIGGHKGQVVVDGIAA